MKGIRENMGENENKNQAPLLEVKHLSLSFSQYDRGLKRRTLPVIRDLSLTVKKGEIVAVVGASGSGKSLLAHAVFGILPYNARMEGEIFFQGTCLEEAFLKKIRGTKMALVPQGISWLDPLKKTGWQIRNGKNKKEDRERCRELLKRFGLDEKTAEKYPFELSGGMAKRVLLASALFENPSLVIADEPTPGLHPQAALAVMEEFRKMADEGRGVLVITHDLELAVQTADRILVFYAGETIEEARASDFFSEEKLRHPYTKDLYRAMPAHGFLAENAGVQPYVLKREKNGCLYQGYCEKRCEKCLGEIPYRKSKGGYVRCIFGEEEERNYGTGSERFDISLS